MSPREPREIRALSPWSSSAPARVASAACGSRPTPIYVHASLLSEPRLTPNKNGRPLLRAPPDSQFFTVPMGYRISATMSRYLYQMGLSRDNLVGSYAT